MMQYNNLELIAIHIKKTGGMSFKKILKKEYKKKYYRMNISPKTIDRKAAFQEHLLKMPEKTEVIHGHFLYHDVEEIILAKPDVSVVTWLRDPAQRVISSYYYMKRKDEDGIRKNTDTLSQYSLLEFAESDAFRNEMSRVLSGVSLTDLAFVGLLEYINEDLSYLTKLFDWKEYIVPKANTNLDYKSRFPTPTSEQLAEIERLNQADVDLYQEALVMRRNRPVIESNLPNGQIDSGNP